MAVVVTTASAFLVGCGDGQESEPAAAPETATVEPGTETAAAELRARLTHLLAEHVELTGIAILQAAQTGFGSAEVEAATDALESSSEDLAGEFASLYGDPAGRRFLELWDSHVDLLLDYAAARAAGDRRGQQQARAGLGRYRADFGALIESATSGGLAKDAVSAALRPHTASMLTTVDAAASRRGNPFVQLQQAAGQMPDLAALLSGAIAEQHALDGATASGASGLRSNLTALLDENIYAALIALETTLEAGGDLKDSSAGPARVALRATTDELSATVGSVYGDAAGERFKELWAAHIGFFVDYALASSSDRAQAARNAEQDLEGFRRDFGAFLQSTNPRLTGETAAEALEPRVQSLLSTIDSAVAGDTRVYDRLRTAAGHNADLAKTLAGAIAAQFPDRFGSS